MTDDTKNDTTPPPAAADTIPPPPSSFGMIDVVPEADPPIPRGKAREAVLAAFLNLTHAVLEAEALAMALARLADETATTEAP